MPKLIDHATRRLELVNAAWDLIAADGVDAATVRHVAERARVAPGSVRYIFPSQDDLLRAVVSELVERVRADIAERASNYSRPEHAAARLSVAVPLSDEQELLWRVERALRFGDVADVSACRKVRANECRDALGALARRVEVPPVTLAFEQTRTLALLEGLAEQLCDSPAAVTREDARSVVLTHVRGVQADWARQASIR